MEQESDKDQRQQDNRGVPGGSNVVWVLLAVGVLTLLAAVLFTHLTTCEIAYPDLIQLIQNSPRTGDEGDARGFRGDMTVQQRKETIRYSDLHDVRVGPHLVTGKVAREVIEPKSPKNKPQKEVTFRTNTSGENARTLLSRQLEQTLIDWDYMPDTTFWGSYLQVFIVVGVILFVFFFMMRRLCFVSKSLLVEGRGVKAKT